MEEPKILNQPQEKEYSEILEQAVIVIEQSRKRTAMQVSAALSHSYFGIGKLLYGLREADDDALSILRSADIRGTKIHIHCFTGSAEFVRKLLALDAEIYVGFTGIVTFKNADNVRDAAREVPAERLLLETDAPYLAPVPFRGKPAHSGYIPLIAQKLAEIRGESLDALYEKCRENTRHCYGI